MCTTRRGQLANERKSKLTAIPAECFSDVQMPNASDNVTNLMDMAQFIKQNGMEDFKVYSDTMCAIYRGVCPRHSVDAAVSLTCNLHPSFLESQLQCCFGGDWRLGIGICVLLCVMYGLLFGLAHPSENDLQVRLVPLRCCVPSIYLSHLRHPFPFSLPSPQPRLSWGPSRELQPQLTTAM